MEQITKKDGVFYYGNDRCSSVDDAYSKFRKDYHKSIGRAAYKRLDRLGQRKERIHGFGFVFENKCLPPPSFERKAICRIIGLVGISYVRVMGLWDYKDIPDDEFDDWLDYVYLRGSGAIKTIGLNLKVGRTSKRLKRRYR